MFIPRYLQESKSIWWKKALGWAEDWKWTNRMVVVDDLLVQLRIEILFRNVSQLNKRKIPFSFTFEIIFTIIPDYFNTNTRRCLAEPWASFMSNVLIGLICRNVIKKRKSRWRSCSTWYCVFLIRSMDERCSHSGNSSKTTGIIFSEICVDN